MTRPRLRNRVSCAMLPAVLALIACGGQGGNAGPATNGDGSSSGGASDTDAGPSLPPSGGDSGALMAGEDSGGSSVGAEGGTGATGYGDAGGASEAGAAMMQGRAPTSLVPPMEPTARSSRSVTRSPSACSTLGLIASSCFMMR